MTESFNFYIHLKHQENCEDAFINLMQADLFVKRSFLKEGTRTLVGWPWGR